MKEISSLSNSYIVYLSKLNTKKARKEYGRFLVEGYHLVEEAYKSKKLLSVLSTNIDDLIKYDIDAKYLVTKDIIKKLSTTINPQTIIGEVVASELKDLHGMLKNAKKIVILEDINDPGNLGTIIRTAVAFGYDGIITSKNSVDFFNEKTVRASQGTIFKIPLISMDITDAIDDLSSNGFNVYGTSLNTTGSINDVKKNQKFALVFGNEAHGMSEKTEKQTCMNFKLEMKNNVESLNVSVACSIILYELSK